MKNKRFLSIFMQLILTYIATNLIFLMVFGSRHPFINLIESWPPFGQMLLTLPISIVFYMIAGYLFVVAKRHEAEISAYYQSSIIGLALINIIVFVIVHLISSYTYDRGVWVLYSFINPAFGSLLYDISEVNVSWFWIVSGVFSPLGLGLGIYLRLYTLRRGKE